MRILLICPFFPPENKIAAVRIAKFSEHWARAGHEVRVLTRVSSGDDLAIPNHENLVVTRVADPSAKSVLAIQSLKPARPGRLQRLAGAAYAKSMSLVWPDIYRRWSKAAEREARSWIWKPDAVVASVGPFSTLMLGTRLADHFGARLAIDYRDLLTLSTYYPHGPLRRAVDGRIERRAAERASLLATVSKPLADELAEEYDRPSIVVTNGYDPADFARFDYEPDATLRITYCGWVIPHRRDPKPFLTGVARFIEDRPEADIAIDFYGPPSAEVAAAVEQLGLQRHVTQHGRVNHEESLRLQANSDALLLLLWNDPGEVGVLSGKVFEYIGAGRPIIMTGLEDGAAGELIASHGLGVVSNDPDAIAAHLSGLADEKSRTGRVSGPLLHDAEQFTRDAQSRSFLDALEQIVED